MSAIQRCLIANRGEIAVRIAGACRLLGIAPVAVYTAADRDLAHVALCDHAVPLGEPLAYLDSDRLIDAARSTGCDAVHPGYGFLSESAAFAAAVRDAGMTWVGPSAESIAAMGSKTEARAHAAAAGVPVVPGTPPLDDDALQAAAAGLPYPLLVKAAGGGGGRGMRIVHTPDALADALAAARREAAAAFGDDRVFIESYIAGGFHVEVQVLGDTHGALVHLYERDCSAQRRHQKIVEESPSVQLTPVQRAALCAAAVAAARAVDYVNAGTVEFIVTPTGAFYFLEMNTRIQVEHPVTEAVTGIDLVAWQFRVAAGEPLAFAQADVSAHGHAIECRVYAEDPRAGFAPAPGRLLVFEPPRLPFVRVETAARSGETISHYYDPLIAKIIAAGTTRADAIARMRLALRQTVVLGVSTNLPLLQALIAHPAFAAGAVDTTFVERELTALLGDDVPNDALLIAAALAEMLGGAGQGSVSSDAAGGTSADAGAADAWARADGFRIGGG